MTVADTTQASFGMSLQKTSGCPNSSDCLAKFCQSFQEPPNSFVFGAVSYFEATRKKHED